MTTDATAMHELVGRSPGRVVRECISEEATLEAKLHPNMRRETALHVKHERKQTEG